MGTSRALPITWGVHVDFRLLGEIEVRSAGRPLDIGTPQQQLVLAALLVDARRPVPIETLVDRVWGHDPPANPRPVLYAHLSRIRALLRRIDGGTPARIERRHAGYVLDVDPERIDLHRFRRLVADRQPDDGTRAATLAEALDLWRGEPLAGLSGAWAAQVRAGWHQRRLDAAVQWAQTAFRLGRATAVISAVPDLAAEYPLAEPLEHVLIQALHATGRDAEALHRYGVVRRRLAEELGADPGRDLQTLYRTVLTPPPPPRRPTIPPPGAAPPEPVAPPPTGAPHRRALLAVLAVVLLPAAAGWARLLRPDTCDRPTPSIARAQQLFATAEEFDLQDRQHDARATVMDAVRLWQDLIALDPDRNAPPLAPAALRALTRAGLDFTVPRPTVLTWLGNPTRTPYPAITQVILLHGWRFTAPISLDAIVQTYEHTPETPSPRTATDVHTETLKSAVLTHARTRHGTHPTDFDQLLEP
ncbi:AfsR/SARP family transcriptional regulator [Kitasatospora griseola]|uniref:AfsR/SARP family transcriptional regulator n=1 Tax=Kitasatospora griseola TaxID=2064 RepID=UPI0038223996